MRKFNYKVLLIIIFSVIFLFSCAQNVELRSFTDPSIQSSVVKKVAIFPIRNARILPGESRELVRSFTIEFLKKNPGITIISATKATDLLNKNKMTEKYAEFLRDYAVSGIPNARILKNIGKILGVDAIVQGEIFDFYQKDGHYPGVMARTSLTMRYYLLSTSKGDVLWETTCSASLKPSGLTASVWSPPPPLIDVIKIAQEKILSDIPYLGK